MKKKRLPIWIYGLHFIQERIRKPSMRNNFANTIAKLLPRNTFSNSHKKYLDELEINGFTLLPDLVDEFWIERVKEQLRIAECFDPWDRGRGLFRIEDAPDTTHVAQIKDVSRIQEVVRLANNDKILSIVGNFFKCTPTLDSVQAWWSLNGHESPQEAEYYHRDNDGLKFVKFFMYLTDVDDGSGPHLFVKGSHLVAKGLERRRYDDDEIIALFGEENVVKFTGSRGLAFLENTYGFHKGQMPNRDRRLLVQFRYSILPTIFNNLMN
ncbi:phytanoyl-CoA dioxygenase family protein [Jiulongibacter sp. NS-SX5]|uniref:phytanoyl-CoA dioxygenase family protein n=1 Tax=Jiulongibacter sp. NS-SX5 TaxID=3463854 RepID=UPI00405A32C8